MNPDLQLFTSTVIAVFLEASPFLLLGALLASVFEIHMPPDRIERYVPKGLAAGLLLGLGAGMLIPTCECGVVSIVRRLLRNGVPPHVALTYMLSAPVINPLVLASTYIAFRGDLRMIVGRVLIVAVCAGALGLALSGVKPARLLREGNACSVLAGAAAVGGHGDEPSHPPHHACLEPACACGCGAGVRAGEGVRLTEILTHTAAEFLEMGKYLVLGAFAVGLFKVLMSQELLAPFEDNIFLAIWAMMLLAVLLSVCSEADAFVAASFTSFPAAAQLSFVALGPMVDLKLMAMYGAVFQRRVVLVLIVAPSVLVYSLSFLLGTVLWG